MAEPNGKKLKLGLPKGSLEQATFQLLQKAGFLLALAPRSYNASLDDCELEGILLRAQEIAKYVEDGVFDAGLTGKDWIIENEARVVEAADLLYARQTLRPVRWVLAVPENSSIRTVQDLEGKRIATELVRTTCRFLEECGVRAEVEFSWGATEVKTPLLVDAIVEATETGRSLKANGLRIVETVLVSTTRLIVNPKSWQDAWKRNKIENLVTLLQGAVMAMGRVGLKMNIPRDSLSHVIRCLPAMKTPTISALYDPGWVAVEIIIEEKRVRELIPELKRCGARDIIEYPLNKVIP
ncbi:MAG TPA: ATP phosphoribosyltransferase [bacterium]|nr:ATP phosphoribosyltransferase [bacterium]